MVEIGTKNNRNRLVVQVRFRQRAAHDNNLRQNGHFKHSENLTVLWCGLKNFLPKHLRPGRITKHLVERPSLALALIELHFRLVDQSQLAVLAGLS